MNHLVDKFPTTVTIDGAEVPINTDFRVSIQFTDLLSSGGLSDDEAVLNAMQLYYKEPPSDLNKAFEMMLWFYQGGKEPPKGKSKEPIYDFGHDYDYIYAAYLDQYSVDLNEVEYLHWWKFRAMFSGLKDDAMIEKIMMYRSIEVRDLPKEQQPMYRKLKRIYKLPRNVADEDKKHEDELTQALLNGGDVSSILKE